MAVAVMTQRPGETTASASVIAIPIWQRVAARTIRVYLITILGLLGASAAGGTGTFDPLPAGAFFEKLAHAASYAIGPAVVALLWNLVELLGKLDERFPKLRG
jgi:hypothetical protein